ncbi:MULTISPECIES: DoxX family protein [Chryseobacterium]|jgi:putative oxidoreductase|uniref:DoxX family protein n=1 Tax=Chryseobacterium rhizosphaerae TaxID=395937 RepID=A0AAE3Y6H6_9FLAO|nr:MULTISPECIES: DoxX family protein [Chryseobacterium]MBL3549085.1 DoxX family protein [Chryseobacterium sp. KMC2]MDC8100025.1 DoxX family protein [Chryseobacterium rhizosphaerae]MDR6524849.1 putative oxidoreductase [Chryseobacterium rhizosphaerae]MDR6546965.1 putative oxidoreductase [Chryseobacterium rhizosphaerae]REC74933.1 DoxX family protein [Chryseobacterium rhizosphaerae]
MNYTDSNSSSILKDIILFAVRVFVGFAMLSHGFPKLQMLLEGGKIEFFDFMGLGPQISLILTVFAEFVCSILLILGLFTRISLGFLIFTMAIAGFFIHGADPFEKRELSLIYLSVYLLLMAFGAGKFSVDHMIEKRKRASDW